MTSITFGNGTAEGGTTDWAADSGTETLTSSTTYAVTGTHSFKLTPYDLYAGDVARMLSIRFPCTPGDFSFKAYLRTTGCTAQGQMTLVFWNSAGGFMGYGGADTVANGVTGTGWTLLEGTITAPAGTASVDVDVGVIYPSVVLNSTNPVYIDDILIIPAPSARLSLKLANGSWVDVGGDARFKVRSQDGTWWHAGAAGVGSNELKLKVADGTWVTATFLIPP